MVWQPPEKEPFVTEPTSASGPSNDPAYWRGELQHFHQEHGQEDPNGHETTTPDLDPWKRDFSSHHGPLHQQTNEVAFSYRHNHFQESSDDEKAMEKPSWNRHNNFQRDNGKSSHSNSNANQNHPSHGDNTPIQYHPRFPGETNARGNGNSDSDDGDSDGNDVEDSWVVRQSNSWVVHPTNHTSLPNHSAFQLPPNQNLSHEHEQEHELGTEKDIWVVRQNNNTAQNNAQAAEILLHHIQNLYGGSSSSSNSNSSNSSNSNSSNSNTAAFDSRDEPPIIQSDHVHGVEYRDEQTAQDRTFASAKSPLHYGGNSGTPETNATRENAHRNTNRSKAATPIVLRQSHPHPQLPLVEHRDEQPPSRQPPASTHSALRNHPIRSKRNHNRSSSPQEAVPSEFRDGTNSLSTVAARMLHHLQLLGDKSAESRDEQREEQQQKQSHHPLHGSDNNSSNPLDRGEESRDEAFTETKTKTEVVQELLRQDHFTGAPNETLQLERKLKDDRLPTKHSNSDSFSIDQIGIQDSSVHTESAKETRSSSTRNDESMGIQADDDPNPTEPAKKVSSRYTPPSPRRQRRDSSRYNTKEIEIDEEAIQAEAAKEVAQMMELSEKSHYTITLHKSYNPHAPAQTTAANRINERDDLGGASYRYERSRHDRLLLQQEKNKERLGELRSKLLGDSASFSQRTASNSQITRTTSTAKLKTKTSDEELEADLYRRVEFYRQQVEAAGLLHQTKEGRDDTSQRETPMDEEMRYRNSFYLQRRRQQLGYENHNNNSDPYHDRDERESSTQNRDEILRSESIRATGEKRDSIMPGRDDRRAEERYRNRKEEFVDRRESNEVQPTEERPPELDSESQQESRKERNTSRPRGERLSESYHESQPMPPKRKNLDPIDYRDEFLGSEERDKDDIRDDIDPKQNRASSIPSQNRYQWNTNSMEKRKSRDIAIQRRKERQQSRPERNTSRPRKERPSEIYSEMKQQPPQYEGRGKPSRSTAYYVDPDEYIGEPAQSQRREGTALSNDHVQSALRAEQAVEVENILIDLIRRRKYNFALQRIDYFPDETLTPASSVDRNFALHEMIIQMAFDGDSRGWERGRDRLREQEQEHQTGFLEATLTTLLIETNPKALSTPGNGGYLPLHIACAASFPTRLRLIRSMLAVYSEAASHNDNQLGELPLHIAIRWICKRCHAIEEDHEGEKEDEPIVMFLLMAYPEGATTQDQSGMTPYGILKAAASREREHQRGEFVASIVQRLERYMNFASQLPQTNFDRGSGEAYSKENELVVKTVESNDNQDGPPMDHIEFADTMSGTELIGEEFCDDENGAEKYSLMNEKGRRGWDSINNVESGFTATETEPTEESRGSPRGSNREKFYNTIDHRGVFVKPGGWSVARGEHDVSPHYTPPKHHRRKQRTRSKCNDEDDAFADALLHELLDE